jgi:hypothetical protein
MTQFNSLTLSESYPFSSLLAPCPTLTASTQNFFELLLDYHPSFSDVHRQLHYPPGINSFGILPLVLDIHPFSSTYLSPPLSRLAPFFNECRLCCHIPRRIRFQLLSGFLFDPLIHFWQRALVHPLAMSTIPCSFSIGISSSDSDATDAPGSSMHRMFFVKAALPGLSQCPKHASDSWY